MDCFLSRTFRQPRQQASAWRLLIIAVCVFSGLGQGSGAAQTVTPHGLPQVSYTVSGVVLQGSPEVSEATPAHLAALITLRGYVQPGQELRFAGSAKMHVGAGHYSAYLNAQAYAYGPSGEQVDQNFTPPELDAKTNHTVTDPTDIVDTFDVHVKIPLHSKGAKILLSFRVVRDYPSAVYETDLSGNFLGAAPTTSTEASTPTATSKPATSKPATLTPTQKLDKILARYRGGIQTPPSSVRVPLGTAGAVNIINGLSSLAAWAGVGHEVLGSYTCGGYQAQVLRLLDSIKFSDDPDVRSLLDDFDYGPIQSAYGYHQAVVIYPRGSDWLHEGIVLDPWPDQLPETFPIAIWGSMNSIGTWAGISGSKAYETAPRYPTVGGAYRRPGAIDLTVEERQWAQSLDQTQKDKLAHITDVDQRNQVIQDLYARRKQRGIIVVNCKVNVSLVNARGQVTGFTANGYESAAPGVTIDRVARHPGDWQTLVQFDPTVDFQLVLSATQPGPVDIGIASGTGQAPLAIWGYTAPLTTGDRLTTNLYKPLSNLTGARKSFTALTSTSKAQEVTTTPLPAKDLINTWNTGAVRNGPTAPTAFTIGQPCLITEISDYHWNSGRGQPAGTILLQSGDGRLYGPWIVTTSSGSGAMNVGWTVHPNVVIPTGTYKVVDSSPATWSQNAASGGRGFSEVKGVLAATR